MGVDDAQLVERQAALQAEGAELLGRLAGLGMNGFMSI
jgi:hypothetical protein